LESFKKDDTVKDEVSINSSVPTSNELLNLTYTKQEPAAVVESLLNEKDLIISIHTRFGEAEMLMCVRLAMLGCCQRKLCGVYVKENYVKLIQNSSFQLSYIMVQSCACNFSCSAQVYI